MKTVKYPLHQAGVDGMVMGIDVNNVFSRKIPRGRNLFNLVTINDYLGCIENISTHNYGNRRLRRVPKKWKSRK